jgi:hypothetical protein
MSKRKTIRRPVTHITATRIVDAFFAETYGGKHGQMVKAMEPFADAVDALHEMLRAEWMVTPDWGGDRDHAVDRAWKALRKATGKTTRWLRTDIAVSK